MICVKYNPNESLLIMANYKKNWLCLITIMINHAWLIAATIRTTASLPMLLFKNPKIYI